MKLILSQRAEKQLRKISKVEQIAIAKKIRCLKDKECIPREEKLEGFKNIFRVRIGDYRIVYKKTVSELFIILIGHRKDIYRLLRQLFD